MVQKLSYELAKLQLKIGKANCGPLLPRIAISFLFNYFHLKKRKLRKKNKIKKREKRARETERARELERESA